MSEIPPILTTQKDKPSGKAKKLVKYIGVAGIFFLIGLFLGLSLSKIQSFHARSQEVQIVNLLRSFQYPQDLNNAQPYCTEKGFAVLKEFTDAGISLRTYKSPELSTIKMNGNSCDVELTRDNAEGVSVVWVRLAKEDKWKFEDIYLKEINNRELDCWYSDYQKSPALYTAWAYRRDIASGIQNTADTIDQLNKIGKELDQLFGDKPNDVVTNSTSDSLSSSDF